jgi:serine phosphatase RsbU (regulator of sigma subunit)
MRRYITAIMLATALASCEKETFEKVEDVKNRIAIAEDGDVSFFIASETLQKGDTVYYQTDGIAYQLHTGDEVATVTRIIYQ